MSIQLWTWYDTVVEALVWLYPGTLHHDTSFAGLLSKTRYRFCSLMFVIHTKPSFIDWGFVIELLMEASSKFDLFQGLGFGVVQSSTLPSTSATSTWTYSQPSRHALSSRIQQCDTWKPVWPFTNTILGPCSGAETVGEPPCLISSPMQAFKTHRPVRACGWLPNVQRRWVHGVVMVIHLFTWGADYWCVGLQIPLCCGTREVHAISCSYWFSIIQFWTQIQTWLL